MRIALILLGLLFGLCVLCAVAGYFVALPRVQDELETSIEEAVGTHMAPKFSGTDGSPGTAMITEAELNAEIDSGDPNLEDLQVRITPEFLEFRFGEQSQDLVYRTAVAAVDGQFAVVDPDLAGVPGWVLPESSVSDGLVQGINGYLEENGLTLTSVTLGDGVMTVTTE
ncbi:MAG: hypothetical protein R2839_07925 [Thermomicrobiales bacterium]